MILAYHKVEPVVKTHWYVSVDAFNRQMCELQSYDVVPLSKYDPTNPRHACITFDGIYWNIAKYALPLLKKWNYPFELFIIGDYVGKDNGFDQHTEPPCNFATIAELKKLVAAGGFVQWHSSSHKRMVGMDQATLERELCVPKSLKDEFGGSHFQWFAYPHGDFDSEAETKVKSYFNGALACDDGDPQNKYLLPRKLVFENTKLSKTKVSLVVANYNYASYLPEAIESALSQTVPADEVIVIDDASTDRSKDILEQYQDKVKVIINERNLGIVDNFNKAVQLTSGDYVCFLGADNRFRSDYIELLKSALDKNSEAGVAYTDMTIFGPLSHSLAGKVGAQQTEFSDCYVWRFPNPTPETIAKFKENNFIHGSSMFRRTAYDEVGGYKKTDGPEDHNLFFRIVSSGWKPIRIAETLVEYRQHSIEQANTTLNLMNELVALRRAYRELKANAHSGSIESYFKVGSKFQKLRTAGYHATGPYRKQFMKFVGKKLVNKILKKPAPALPQEIFINKN